MTSLTLAPQQSREIEKPKERKFQRFLFFTYIILVLCVFSIRDFLSIPIPQYALVAIVGAYIPFASYKNLVSYSTFLIPIVTGMNTIICLFLFIGLLFKCPKISKAQYLFTIMLVIIEIINFTSWQNAHRINDIIIYIGVLSLFLFLFFDKTKGVDYAMAIKLFCIATVFVFSAICYRSYQVFGPIGIFAHRMGDVSLYDESLNENLRVFSLNANNVGYFSVVVYACLLLGAKRLHIKPLFLWVLIAADIIIAAFTVSRTWLLLVCLLTLFYGILCMKKWKLALLITCVSAFGGGISVYFSDFVEPFQKRLTNNDMESANGRTGLFEEYVEFLERNPDALPIGIGAVGYNDVANRSNAMHNASQQIFVCTGIVGLIIFIIIPIIFYRQFIQNKHIYTLYFFPIAAAFLFVQTIQFLNPFFLMLPFIVCAMTIKMGAQNASIQKIHVKQNLQ